MNDEDPYHLERFVTAQRDVYPDVLAELRAGRKRSHWMWFIFPQLEGLGRSPTAVRYAIKSRAEAEAYLKHPVLGARLRECTRLVNSHDNVSAYAIFGDPDDLKFRSCMTLFARINPDETIFAEALQAFFKGEPDPATIQRLS